MLYCSGSKTSRTTDLVGMEADEDLILITEFNNMEVTVNFTRKVSVEHWGQDILVVRGEKKKEEEFSSIQTKL